jgi:hypothetical protein
MHRLGLAAVHAAGFLILVLFVLPAPVSASGARGLGHRTAHSRRTTHHRRHRKHKPSHKRKTGRATHKHATPVSLPPCASSSPTDACSAPAVHPSFSPAPVVPPVPADGPVCSGTGSSLPCPPVEACPPPGSSRPSSVPTGDGWVTIALAIDTWSGPPPSGGCDVAGQVTIESSTETPLSGFESVMIEQGSVAVLTLPAGEYVAVASDTVCHEGTAHVTILSGEGAVLTVSMLPSGPIPAGASPAQPQASTARDASEEVVCPL